MKQLVYADNAATTRLDPAALEAMLPYLANEYGNPSQKYAFSRTPRNALNEARATIAACIGAETEEIIFTSGGTESDNWVIKASAFSDPDKRATITSAFEHHAILHSCAAIERLGYPVAYIRPTKTGYVTAEALESYITDGTRLVSVMYANNELGTIQPINDLCQTAHRHGASFHTDAVQAVGHVPINVKELGVDYLSASAHKFNGPRGIGFLYIRKGAELAPHLDGGAQEGGKRAGTENVAAIVAMATALRNNCESMEVNARKISLLEDALLAMLRAARVPFVYNSGSEHLPGIINLSFRGKDGEAILHRLDLLGVCISTGAACNSKSTEISHVLKSIQLEDELAKGTIRISLGKDNTRDDVEQIVVALQKVLA